MMQVSVDCPLLIAPSVFSYVYLQCQSISCVECGLQMTFFRLLRIVLACVVSSIDVHAAFQIDIRDPFIWE